MSRPFVALLYSISIAEGRRLVMADLRDLAADLGLERPRTLLATGNLLFEAEGDARAIEARLEPAFAERFGRAVSIIVRDGTGWPRLMAANPFPEAAEREPARVAVRVMRTPADAAAVARLSPYLAPGERLAVAGGDLWVHLPDGFAPSRLPGAITPRREGIGTFRNWNTVKRIGAALAG
ncbi:DUF1697 domain-containing protein [Amaricoccus sp.]|uniref:DUF1697 domain-containing protein n=1 Tax=Amaricoccus sp. TaxID=1872485 RepID=UPI002610BFA8|nr:DUF1697 domain-containing protein [Amaricoccus sp.]HRO11347.1 DUF1697 domain-containing protein [Amaricoccus sp.]